jgi:Protein of unknown function (DUF1353)
MPFVAAKSSAAEPNLAPPLVELAYFTVSEANAERRKLPEAERGKPIAVPLWQLKVPFGYVREEDNEYFDVPAHGGNVAIYSNHTDLATIPGFLWGILAPFGRQMRPALLHDRRCDLAHAQQHLADMETDPAQAKQLREKAIAIRKEADYLFRESLGAERVGLGRRLIFWAGVSFGRFLGFQKARGVLLSLAVGLAALVALHAVALSAHLTIWAANRWVFGWPFWVVVGGLFVAALIYLKQLLLAAALPLIGVLVGVLAAGTGARDVGWPHSWSVHLVVAVVTLVAALVAGLLTDARVALIGVVISPVVVPVIVVTVTAELLFALPDLRKRASGDSGGLGPIMPTMLRWRVR